VSRLTAAIPFTIHEEFLNDILRKTIVLALNRNWQAINGGST
jgi:hypothetical protein